MRRPSTNAVRGASTGLALRTYGAVARRVMGRDRRVHRRGLRLAVPRGVFHPGLFFSTKALDDEMATVDLAGATLLDVGTGSGFLAIRAAQRGATVTAIDVNPTAVEAARANVAANGVSATVEVVESDLFAGLDGRRFDVVVVNPPYFPAEPTTMADRAFYAGAGFSWFRRFFAGLGEHVHATATPTVLMVLGGHCDVDAVATIASEHGWSLQLRRTVHRLLTPQLLFRVRPASS